MSKKKTPLACDYCGQEKPADHKWFTIGWRPAADASGETRPTGSKWRFCSWGHLKAFASADGIKSVTAGPTSISERQATGREMFPEITSRGDEPEG